MLKFIMDPLPYAHNWTKAGFQNHNTFDADADADADVDADVDAEHVHLEWTRDSIREDPSVLAWAGRLAAGALRARRLLVYLRLPSRNHL